jgi:CDP-diacylglycerol--glycerol-3-phosphate 3-phosphatidyltransferase
MSRRTLQSIPNLLSVLRIALALPIVLAIRYGAPAVAASLFLLACATDALDGWLARRLGSLTPAGRVLDPLADKILAASVALALWRWRALPAWFLGAVLLRDLLLLAGGGLLARRTREVPVSNRAGKAAFALLASVLFVYLADWRRLQFPALAAGTIALVVSFAIYASALVSRRPAAGSDRDNP